MAEIINGRQLSTRCYGTLAKNFNSVCVRWSHKDVSVLQKTLQHTTGLSQYVGGNITRLRKKNQTTQIHWAPLRISCQMSHNLCNNPWYNDCMTIQKNTSVVPFLLVISPQNGELPTRQRVQIYRCCQVLLLLFLNSLGFFNLNIETSNESYKQFKQRKRIKWNPVTQVG